MECNWLFVLLCQLLGGTFLCLFAASKLTTQLQGASEDTFRLTSDCFLLQEHAKAKLSWVGMIDQLLAIHLKNQLVWRDHVLFHLCNVFVSNHPQTLLLCEVSIFLFFSIKFCKAWKSFTENEYCSKYCYDIIELPVVCCNSCCCYCCCFWCDCFPKFYGFSYRFLEFSPSFLKCSVILKYAIRIFAESESCSKCCLRPLSWQWGIALFVVVAVMAVVVIVAVAVIIGIFGWSNNDSWCTASCFFC